MTRDRSLFLARHTVAVATLLATSGVTFMGCAPSGRTGAKREVVEIETIEALDPAADQTRKNAQTAAIDEEAAAAVP